MLMNIQKDARVKDMELFKAVVSGHCIDLEATVKREVKEK